MYIDVACSYIPVEIIHAAGFIPGRLIPPAPKEVGLMPRTYCSYARACVMTKNTPVVFTTCCDGMRRCYDIKKTRGNDVFILDLPQQVTTSNIKLYRQELLELTRWLGQKGNPVQIKKLKDSMAIYQEIYHLLKEIQKDFGAGVRFYNLVLKVLTGNPEEALKTLKNFKDEHKEKKPVNKGQGILLAGTILPDDGIIKLFEESNMPVIMADFCTWGRQYSVTYSLDEDPWLDLARAYLSKTSCPRMAGQGRRVSHIKDILEKTGASGVILYGIKFCNHGLYEVPLWRTLCKERGIPFLYIEGEYKAGVSAQSITRIQAFLERI